jgi:hypothetical protein
VHKLAYGPIGSGRTPKKAAASRKYQLTARSHTRREAPGARVPSPRPRGPGAPRRDWHPGLIIAWARERYQARAPSSQYGARASPAWSPPHTPRTHPQRQGVVPHDGGHALHTWEPRRARSSPGLPVETRALEGCCAPAVCGASRRRAQEPPAARLVSGGPLVVRAGVRGPCRAGAARSPAGPGAWLRRAWRPIGWRSRTGRAARPGTP